MFPSSWQILSLLSVRLLSISEIYFLPPPPEEDPASGPLFNRTGEAPFPIRSTRSPGQHTAKPFAVRCPANTCSCKHGSRLPGLSHKKQKHRTGAHTPVPVFLSLYILSCRNLLSIRSTDKTDILVRAYIANIFTFTTLIDCFTSCVCVQCAPVIK